MIVIFEIQLESLKMGFKSLLLLICLIFVVLFSLQNLQPISLVFLGFSSLSLPLSIWVIVSLVAGIISSLFIQLLTRSSSSKNNNYYNPPIPTPPQNNYPPSATQQVSPTNNNFVPPRVTEPTTTLSNNVDEEFDIFDDRQWGDNEVSRWVENEPSRVTNPETKEPTPPPPVVPATPTRVSEDNFSSSISQDTVEPIVPEDDYSQTDSLSQTPTQQPEKISPPPPPTSPEDNVPSPSLLKNREASLYSYQPQEKTVFREPLPPLEKKQRQNDRRQADDKTSISSSSKSNPIYDAPFRVIAPGQKNTPPPPANRPITDNIDDDWNDEDDWDF